MRADGVVVMPPAFDDDLSFPQRVEDLAVEQFVLQARIKTFGKAVLSRAAWRDVGGLPRRFVQELADASSSSNPTSSAICINSQTNWPNANRLASGNGGSHRRGGCLWRRK